MKKLFFTFLTALLFISCASTNAATRKISKQYTVNSTFNAVCVNSNIEVDYTPAGKVSITATAEQQALETLTIYVTEKILHIETNDNNKNLGRDKEKIKVKLSAPALRKYIASGNSEIDVKGALSIDGQLIVNTSGNSEVEFEYKVDCGTIVIGTSGNSKVSFEKNTACTEVQAGTSGNSTLDINGIVCNTLHLGSSGNSNIDVENINAKTVTAGSSGNSEIELAGQADTATLGSSGNSDIDARKLTARNNSTSATGNSSVRR